MKKIVSLDPGESKVVGFTFTPTTDKAYTVNVDGLTGSFIAITPVLPSVANLSGVVTNADTGSPLSGVKVTIDGLTTYTNASGIYGFVDLEPGNYTVTFEKDGFETEIR